MNHNRITKSSAIGYAVDSALEALHDDLLCHPEVFPDAEAREEAIRLFEAIVRHAPRAQRRYWAEELRRRPIR